MKDEFIEKAKSAKRESKYIDFKKQLDADSKEEWIEIIKDIIAMANSGGGVILIGVNDNGTPSGVDVTPILNYDPAKLTDKIESYTGEHFSEFEVFALDIDGQQVAALRIYAVAVPIVFARPGIYEVNGKPKAVFARGAAYFRHGAKSEPGTTNDLRKFLDRELEIIRKSWLGNIRKIVEAPRGSIIQALPMEVVESGGPDAIPIRIVDDLAAPVYQKLDPDRTHPYRQKEVWPIINEKLDGRKAINSHDLLCIRRVHGIDDKYQFCYKSRFATPQYSEQFIDWLIQQYEADNLFFEKAREAYKNLR
jgi:hypothetical protein